MDFLEKNVISYKTLPLPQNIIFEIEKLLIILLMFYKLITSRLKIIYRELYLSMCENLTDSMNLEEFRMLVRNIEGNESEHVGLYKKFKKEAENYKTFSFEKFCKFCKVNNIMGLPKQR
jgi:hypothetical protein